MQVTFSDSSLATLETLPQLRRVEVIGQLGDLRREQFNGNPSERLGTIHRDGQVLYRVRLDDLRFYFTFTAEGIRCVHILTGHTYEDFLFRCGLSGSKGETAEGSPLFWQLLEEKEQPEERDGK
jgi:hypothetical protein